MIIFLLSIVVVYMYLIILYVSYGPTSIGKCRIKKKKVPRKMHFACRIIKAAFCFTFILE